MTEFWIGIQGELTPEQFTALVDDQVAVDDLRQLASARGGPPIEEWKTLLTFVRVPAINEFEARDRVANVLALEVDNLVAYSGDILG